MSYPRPTISQLQQIAYSKYIARLGGSTGTLRRAVIYVSSWVMAGLVNGLYGYLDYLIRQCFTTTADMDYLIVQGAEFDLPPNGAAYAAGSAIFTGSPDGGAIPPDVALLTDPNGNEYETQGIGIIAGGTVTVAIVALTAGTVCNLAPGTPLTLNYAIANVNATATVADAGGGVGLSGGVDAEDPDSYRGRILARKQEPPQGGNPADYVAWARAVAGVTRAWPYPANRGGGTIDLTFVMDARESIIPLGADVTAVQTAIDAAKPVTDDCVVFAATGSAVNFTIHGTFTAAVEASITAALKDLFATDAIPGGAFNIATQGTFSGGLSLQDQIIPAIAAGAGDTAFNLSAPNADIAGASGVLLTFGAITFEA